MICETIMGTQRKIYLGRVKEIKLELYFKRSYQLREVIVMRRTNPSTKTSGKPNFKHKNRSRHFKVVKEVLIYHLPGYVLCPSYIFYFLQKSCK